MAGSVTMKGSAVKAVAVTGTGHGVQVATGVGSDEKATVEVWVLAWKARVSKRGPVQPIEGSPAWSATPPGAVYCR